MTHKIDSDLDVAVMFREDNEESYKEIYSYISNILYDGDFDLISANSLHEEDLIYEDVFEEGVIIYENRTGQKIHN